jgi:hypothetical protein
MQQTLERCRRCGATLSPDIDWCGQCYTPTREPERVIVVPEAETGPPVPIGVRLLFSALVVVFGAAAFVALDRIVDETGTGAWATAILFLGAYAAIGIVAILTAWRPREG